VTAVVEHGSSRGGRWLRHNRFRIALWIAVVEGVLVLFDVIPAWWAIGVAVLLLAFYVFVGRRLPDSGRELSWIAAFSQLLVAILPVLVALLTVVAIIALVVIAAVALALLFLDRR
jgi:ABC-type dipeptide/oligopeptide/nickel transport system permease component